MASGRQGRSRGRWNVSGDSSLHTHSVLTPIFFLSETQREELEAYSLSLSNVSGDSFLHTHSVFTLIFHQYFLIAADKLEELEADLLSLYKGRCQKSFYVIRP